MVEENGKIVRDHKYHAEGTAVEGLLSLPLPNPTKIEPQAHSQVLPTAKSKVQPSRFYESQQGEPFRIEGIISYGRAYTQAAGHQETKEKGGTFKTLATAVVEDLNILNVVTCDRVVAQVSTTHPRYEDEGHVPYVTFLGTQFDNLRIGGCRVEVDLDLHLLEKHSTNTAYTRHDSFLKCLADRLKVFREGRKDIPEDVTSLYSSDPKRGEKESTEYSLVKEIRGACPWKPFGHVFDIPDFGKIYLAVVKIEHSNFQQGSDHPLTTIFDLTMIKADMGCIGSGTVSCAMGKTNGGTVPPG